MGGSSDPSPSSDPSASMPPPPIAEILLDQAPKDEPKEIHETGKKEQNEQSKQVKKLISFGSPQGQFENKSAKAMNFEDSV